MVGFNVHEAGNKLETIIGDDHFNAEAFVDTEKVESPLMEAQLGDLNADTEELDIPDFVGSLRAQMVDDSDEEVVLDSDDDVKSDKKEGKIRGHLLRRVSSVGAQSVDVHSSAGSNLADRIIDNGPTSACAGNHYQNPCNRQYNEDQIERRDMKRKSTIGDEFFNTKVPFCNFDNENGRMNASVMVHDNELALGGYNESQEPGGTSESNALDFVDHYLSVSIASLSPKVRTPQIGGPKSPLVSCAKGSQNLAMKVNLMSKVGISTFEWDEDQLDHGGEFYFRKKKEIDILKDKHSGEGCKEELQGSIAVNSDKTNSRLGAKNSNLISEVLRTDITERNAYCENKFDKRLDEESFRQLPENSIERDAVAIWDVGFDTQMAAEAMESLLYALPPSMDANGQEGPWNTLDDTSKGATKNKASKRYPPPKRVRRDLQIDGRKLKENKSSNQIYNMSTSSHKLFKNQKELSLELPEIGNDNLAEPKTAHEKSSKFISQKKKEEDSGKEKTFSPVACRTRRGSSVKPFNSTKETTCNLGDVRQGKQVEVLRKRKKDELYTGYSSRKRTKCPIVDSGNIKEVGNRKVFQKEQNRLDGAATTSYLKLDTWNWAKQKRTYRNRRQNAKLTSEICALSSDLEAGIGNGSSLMGVGASGANFREALVSSSVKRKARSDSRTRKKHVKDLSIQKICEPILADVNVTNNESVVMDTRMLPETSAGVEVSHFSKLVDVDSKVKYVLSNGKNTALQMVSSGENRKQLSKRNSTRSSSLRKELTRLGFANSLPEFASKDLRRRRNMVDIRVFFSQSLGVDVIRQQRKIMRRLGTSVAESCSEATHFVIDRFVRTKNMLEAMASGKPVVTHLWLESCGEAKCFIDEKNYILRDAKKEKEIGFNMLVSLSRARAHPLLKDRRVFITPNVEPSQEVIVSLVKAVHGQVVEGIHRDSMKNMKISDDLLILSCEQDYDACVPFLDEGVAVYSSELLLNGIIIQKLEFKRHGLFKDHVKMKRYKSV